MKKILTFDCYGTLLDPSPLYGLIGQIAKEQGLSSEKAIHIFSSYEDRLMYGESFIKYDELLLQALMYCDMEMNCDGFASQYERVILVHKTFQPFPDVLAALRVLKEMGYELVLLSNTTHQMMRWHVEALEHWFDDWLVAEDTKCYKPDLRFFQMAEQKFDLRTREHFHIAKGYWWDIVPASKLGWGKIWVNRAHLKKGKGNGTTVLDGIERIGSAADFGGEQDNSVKSKGLKIQEGFESPSFYIYFCISVYEIHIF